MQIGMIGLVQIGSNMAPCLMEAGHCCVVYDTRSDALDGLCRLGSVGAASLKELAAQMTQPRAVRLMVPAGAVDAVIAQLMPHLDASDIVIDGGNSHHRDDVRRAQQLAASGLHHLDVGTSGGVAGAKRGYCMMIGGEERIVEHLTPLFIAPDPSAGTVARTPGAAMRTRLQKSAFCTVARPARATRLAATMRNRQISRGRTHER